MQLLQILKLYNVVILFSLITSCFSLQKVHLKVRQETQSSRTLSRREFLLPAIPDGTEVSMINSLSSIAQKLAYPIGAYAAFRVGAKLSVIGQPRLPNLQNDDKDNVVVGSKILRLDGGARIRVFYPCEKGLNKNNIKIAPYCTDGKETSDGMAGLVGFRQLGLSFLLEHLATASSGCAEDVAIKNDETTTNDPLPLLVYSHGYGGNMDMACYFMRTLASKGMIVAAVEHTDGTASSTVLSDGTRLSFSPSYMSSKDSLRRRAEEIVRTSDFMQKRFRVGGVFYGGHSYGCPSAILASTLTNNLNGLVLHDPALGMGYSLLPKSGPKVPSISYTSDEYNRGGVRYGDLTLHVKGAFHGNFVDAPLWAPSWVMRPLSSVIPAAGPADPELVHEELANSAIAFMKTKSAFGVGVRSISNNEIENLFEKVG